jgi:hypothetical protein
MDTGQSAICASMHSSGATDQRDLPDPGTLCKVDDFARVVEDKALRGGESRCDAKEDRPTQRRNRRGTNCADERTWPIFE